MTDTRENITIPQLRWRAVMIGTILVSPQMVLCHTVSSFL